MDDLNIVIDVSAVFWDEMDYQANTHEYGKLVDGVACFFEKLENEKPTVLLSSTLIDEMLSDFPYGKPPYNGGDFETQTLRFLSKVTTIEFPSPPCFGIISIPNVVKDHYKEVVKDEINLLISTIHKDNDNENVYFTFKYLWGEEHRLKTQLRGEVKEYRTIVSDRETRLDAEKTELDIFFASIKPVFEHNGKHNKESHKTKEAWQEADDKLGFISQLTCYNGIDNKKPQEILDKRYPQKIDSRYIGYDKDNDVFVVFRNHRDNKYHGYDEYNENNHEKIPLKVKAFFYKK